MSLPNAPSDLSSTQIQPEDLEMMINNLVDRLISEIQSVVVWVGKGAHCDKLIRADFDLLQMIANLEISKHHPFSSITDQRHHVPNLRVTYVKYTQLEERIYFVLFPPCCPVVMTPSAPLK